MLDAVRIFLTLTTMMASSFNVRDADEQSSWTTVPQPVRTALRLVEGDELAYEIDGARVILTKASDRERRRPFRRFFRMGRRRRSEGLCQALSRATSFVCPFLIRIGQPASGWSGFGCLQRRPRGENRRVVLWVAMIASAGLGSTRAWPEDVPFGDSLCKGGPSGAVPHSSLQTCRPSKAVMPRNNWTS